MAKPATPLTYLEQVHLRADIAGKIQEINAKLNENGVRETKDTFIEKFIICETAYKIVLKKYLQVNNRYTNEGGMKIQLTQVKVALKQAGYTVDSELIDRLFSGSGEYKKRGHKSARLLRNSLQHEMNLEDLQELTDRREELFADLDTFIAWIQE